MFQGYSSEEVQEWKHHPLTRIFLQHLEHRAANLPKDAMKATNWETFNQEKGRVMEIEELTRELKEAGTDA